MIGKLLLIVGILLVFFSPLLVLWGIHSSFEAMKLPESAGIGSVVNGLRVAVGSLIAAVAGVILALIGGVKIYWDAKRKHSDRCSLSGLSGS